MIIFTDQPLWNDSLLFSEYELVMESEELPIITEEENLKQYEEISKKNTTGK